MDYRCGDCCNFGLKRDKQGRLTGESVCDQWGLRSSWNPSCSFFINRKATSDMYEALKGIVADLENVIHPDVLEATLAALAKAGGK